MLNKEEIKIQWCELCDDRIGDAEFMKDADLCYAHKNALKNYQNIIKEDGTKLKV